MLIVDVVTLYASGGGGGTGLVGKVTTAGGLMYFTFGTLHGIRVVVAACRRDVDTIRHEIDDVESEYRIRRIRHEAGDDDA